MVRSHRLEDYDDRFNRLVQDKLQRLALQEMIGSKDAPRLHRNVAQHLLANPTPALPLDEALTAFTRWFAEIQHAQIDVTTAEMKMRDRGEKDNADTLVAIGERLGALAEDLKAAHGHLLVIKEAQVEAGRKDAIPLELQGTRRKLKKREEMMKALKAIIPTLDKAHRDLGDNITQEAWDLRREQIDKHGIGLAKFNRNPGAAAYDEMGLTDLDRACKHLEEKLMQSLHGHIAGLYMLAIEEQAKIKLADQHRRR